MRPLRQPRAIWIYAAGLAAGIVLALTAQAAAGGTAALNPQPEPPGATASAPGGGTVPGQE